MTSYRLTNIIEWSLTDVWVAVCDTTIFSVPVEIVGSTHPDTELFM